MSVSVRYLSNLKYCMKLAATAAIPIIIEGLLQVVQRFSSSKLVLKTVESCFMALNYHENGSSMIYAISWGWDIDDNCH